MENVFMTTTERKRMSTKTTFKRIALVAVAALERKNHKKNTQKLKTKHNKRQLKTTNDRHNKKV